MSAAFMFVVPLTRYGHVFERCRNSITNLYIGPLACAFAQRLGQTVLRSDVPKSSGATMGARGRIAACAGRWGRHDEIVRLGAHADAGGMRHFLSAPTPVGAPGGSALS